MLREIILDTETTGLSPQAGHRIIEIGCIELINHLPSGQSFQCYINPERDVPPQSTAITGLTTEFLKPYPLFAEIVDKFLDFIAHDQLIIHNASFDLNFLNFELARLNREPLKGERVTDTLVLARQKFPGSPASLDALCKRFQIDLSKRDKHGALLDSQLLAEVYLELIGGRQRQLGIQKNLAAPDVMQKTHAVNTNFPHRRYPLTEQELHDHQEFLKTIKNNLWSCLG